MLRDAFGTASSAVFLPEPVAVADFASRVSRKVRKAMTLGHLRICCIKIILGVVDPNVAYQLLEPILRPAGVRIRI